MKNDMALQQWFLIENEAAYTKAAARYELLRESARGTSEHKEKMLLASLMNKYQETRCPFLTLIL
jgi:HTH-type transcriptional regulator/antitoxin HigA